MSPQDFSVAQKDFPVAQMVKNLPAMQETRVQSLKILWKKEWQSTPVFLPGASHGQRSMAGYSPWDRKELDTTERLTPLLRGNLN